MSHDGITRVLVIDDDEDDFFLTRDLLQEIPGNRFDFAWEPDWSKGLEAVCSARYDVYLVDYRLGAASGLDLIREAQRRNCNVPLILMTGQGEREIDFAAMKAGAADYLEKGTLDTTLLERSIRYALQKKQSEEHLERRVQERTAELAKANARLEREIRERSRAEHALREVDHRKDDFLATLAHELRNPLAPICNALEILRLSTQNPQSVERGREMMQRQVQYMIRLIDDLLDISRITRGKIQLRKENIDVESIVQNAIEGSQPAIDGGQHQLSVALPTDRVVIHVDGTRLTQVLINLINNAAKFMEPRGEIWLNVETDADEVTFRVRDRGIGIAPEVLPNIFQIFGQQDRNRDRSQGGLGIGLSLVRALVEMHGGRAEARSEGLGKGSEFIVTLPVNADAHAPEAAAAT